MTPRTRRITEIAIDLRRLKPAVLKEVEDRLNAPLSDLTKPGKRQAEALWALAYAVGRRLDSELTYEDAGELEVVLENAPVPPTGAAG